VTEKLILRNYKEQRRIADTFQTGTAIAGNRFIVSDSDIVHRAKGGALAATDAFFSVFLFCENKATMKGMNPTAKKMLERQLANRASENNPKIIETANASTAYQISKSVTEKSAYSLPETAANLRTQKSGSVKDFCE
jgi:hypothetical protein